MQIEKNINRAKFLTIMLVMVISGSVSTITIKILQFSPPGGNFYHPWFVTFNMFIGEFLCLIPYYINEYWTKLSSPNPNTTAPNTDRSSVAEIGNEVGENISLHSSRNLIEPSNKPASSEKPDINIFLIIIPTLCDMCSSTMLYLGLTMMASSVYQMLRGSSIVFIALFSYLVLKSKIYKHNWLGLGSVIIGLIFVGLGSFIDSENHKGDAETRGWGVLLVILSQFFYSGLLLSEEVLMKNYKCEPLKLVGLEGMWGSIIYLGFLFLAYYIPIPCPIKDSQMQKQICDIKVTLFEEEHILENIYNSYNQIIASTTVLFLLIAYVLIIGLLNVVGVWITKHVSATTRSIIDTIRTAIVWIFFLFAPVNKNISEHFDWWQLVGFILLIFGNFIYNEVLVLHFWGLDVDTEAAKDKQLNGTISNNPYLNSNNNEGRTESININRKTEQRIIMLQRW